MQQLFNAMRQPIPADDVSDHGTAGSTFSGKHLADLATANRQWAPAVPALDAIAEDMATLMEVLDAECRLLAELRAILRRQRDGVTADDLQLVNDNVFAAHRVMATLREARRRRRTLVELLTGSETTSFAELEDRALAPRLAPALAEMRARVRREVRALARETGISKMVFDRALGPRDDDEPLRTVIEIKPQGGTC